MRDRENAYFSAVAGDIKLEQAINRFSKGKGGYVSVGSSGNISSVSEFELLFHEVLAITNLVNMLMKDEVMGHLETNIQHTLKGRKGAIFDKNVTKFFDVVNGKGNPFKITLPLHNVLTMTIVDENTKARILNVIDEGKTDYTEFRKVRYVEKVAKVSAKITKKKLLLFSVSNAESTLTKTKSKNDDTSSKEIA